MSKVALVLLTAVVLAAVACGGGSSKSQAADTGSGGTSAPAEGSACPTGCDTPPKGCAIKGNIINNEKEYILPNQAFYGATSINPAQGEKWFCTEDEAKQNGWKKTN